jgi:hypothetical protein
MPRFGLPATSRPALVFLIGSGLLAGSAPAADSVVSGDVYARVSVTVEPDESGTILVPSPFAIVPESNRVVIHVPESGGIFLLEGERILHHYPLVHGVGLLHDMAADVGLFVAGRHGVEGLATVDLWVFDLRTGEAVATIQSKNPHLRVELGTEALWRTLIEDTRVGIFHPGAGASFPLWERETGTVLSAEQMAGASGGIGLAGERKWVPDAGGTVSVWSRGRTVKFVAADRGEFLDAVGYRAVLLSQPAPTVRADADGDFLLSHELGVRLVDGDGVETDFRLQSMSPDVRASRLVIQGRPVRVHGDRIYWIYLGRDFLEIRTVPVSEIPGLPRILSDESSPDRGG